MLLRVTSTKKSLVFNSAAKAEKWKVSPRLTHFSMAWRFLLSTYILSCCLVAGGGEDKGRRRCVKFFSPFCSYEWSDFGQTMYVKIEVKYILQTIIAWVGVRERKVKSSSFFFVSRQKINDAACLLLVKSRRKEST